MASDFPHTLLKGGQVVFPSQTPGPPSQAIVFQYNPERMARSLAMRAAPRDPGNVGCAREDVLRVLGQPGETINPAVDWMPPINRRSPAGTRHPGDPFNPGDPDTIMQPIGSFSIANPTRNTMVNFGRILCPAATGSTCLHPDP
jgi:hypothetical protein